MGEVSMPITLTPERDGRVYVWTYGESFRTTELSDLIDEFQRSVLDKAEKKVYVISDFTAVRHLPPNIMSAGLKMLKKTHPMAGPLIDVTPNGFIFALATALVKLAPPRMVIVRHTIAEAFEEADRLLALEPTEVIQEYPPIQPV